MTARRKASTSSASPSATAVPFVSAVINNAPRDAGSVARASSPRHPRGGPAAPSGGARRPRRSSLSCPTHERGGGVQGVVEGRRQPEAEDHDGGEENQGRHDGAGALTEAALERGRGRRRRALDHG